MTALTTANELQLRRQKLIEAHVDAESNHDIKGTLATFAEANYDVVPLGAPTNGATAVHELLDMLFTAFPDFHADTMALHHGQDIVFADVRMTGTHLGPWAGVPATGRNIDVRCGCVFHFDGDRLLKETVYFDHATLLAQIGIGA
ncbi:MAG: hypothetical protein QOJ19_1220, partial [Acidimicrobiia bacterium]|jgi:steroid delta-isomerase-like uncharacterized protein|nr:hypothetical protein [Acidimicrobiia bacterium]